MNIQELPKYENAYHYLQEPLLDYVIELCNKILPNIDFDENEEPIELSSLAPRTFGIRYHKGKIDKSFRDKFLNDKGIIKTLEDLDFESSKFWYLLLFIKDYTETMRKESFSIEVSGKEQLESFLDKIQIYHNSNRVLTDSKVTISLSVKGKKGAKITNGGAISYLDEIIQYGLYCIEYENVLMDSLIKSNKEKLSKTILFWLFKETFYKFLPDVYPKDITLGKMTLVARLLYLSGFTEDKKYYNKGTAYKVLADMISNCKTPKVMNRIYN